MSPFVISGAVSLLQSGYLVAPFTCTSSFSNLALRKWDLRTTVDAAFSVSASAAAAALAVDTVTQLLLRLLLHFCFGCRFAELCSSKWHSYSTSSGDQLSGCD